MYVVSENIIILVKKYFQDREPILQSRAFRHSHSETHQAPSMDALNGQSQCNDKNRIVVHEVASSNPEIDLHHWTKNDFNSSNFHLMSHI